MKVYLQKIGERTGSVSTVIEHFVPVTDHDAKKQVLTRPAFVTSCTSTPSRLNNTILEKPNAPFRSAGVRVIFSFLVSLFSFRIKIELFEENNLFVLMFLVAFFPIS